MDAAGSPADSRSFIENRQLKTRSHRAGMGTWVALPTRVRQWEEVPVRVGTWPGAEALVVDQGPLPRDPSPATRGTHRPPGCGFVAYDVTPFNATAGLAPGRAPNAGGRWRSSG